MGRTELCSRDGCCSCAGSWQGHGAAKRRRGGPELLVVEVKEGA